MRARRSGAIVQISSMGGRLSFSAVSAYSATKFALEGYSEALAAELAPFGIRVLIVEPGAFRTGLHGSAAAAIRAALDAEDMPLRLPLGNDAADAIADSLDRLRAEFLAWEPVARSTDLDPV